MRYEIFPHSWVLKHCRQLLEDNFRESGLKGFDFKPDLETYEALSATDSFCLVAADEGVPIGICSVFVTRDLHTSQLIAINDTIYCRPEYRERGVGGQLFVRAEREAKARGVSVFFWQVGVDSPLDKALRKRSPIDQVAYARRLA